MNKQELEDLRETREEAFIECLSVVHECPFVIDTNTCVFKAIRAIKNKKDREAMLVRLHMSGEIVDFCDQHLACLSKREEESFMN